MIRYKRPDIKNAKSLLESSKREIDYTYTLKINENSASTIIRNIYECFRMLGDALLVNRGIASQDHVECINELLKLNVKTSRPLGILSNLRILRHNINYYGYRPNIEEVKDFVAFAECCFEPIFKVILKEIEK